MPDRADVRRPRFPRFWKPRLAALIALLVPLCGGHAAGAAQLRIGPGDGPLQAAVERAAPGDTLLLQAGVYPGNLLVDKPLVIQGEPGAVLDAAGQGDVVRVRAPDVTLRGLILRRSGFDLTAMNAAVFVEKSASGVRIEHNRIELAAFGIWLDACSDAQVLGNRISSDPQVRSQDRGNGIHLFAVSGARVEDNEVWDSRDGIYIDTSNRNVLRRNYLHDLRYGIHYMYSYHNEVVGNRTERTRTGYALMQSKFLTVLGNVSERDENYGLLLNFITNSVIAGNRVRDIQRGRVPGGDEGHGVAGAEGKALFVYNALYNEIRDNLFAGAEIGIHLTAGSEDNRIYGNRFEANRTQVKYVANRPQEWSHNGRGNYWSDYLGFDLDGDGIGDIPYEPNDGVDQLLWKYPVAKVLMHSPAVEILRWVQREFPVLKPPGVRDSAPLMQPPPLPAVEDGG
ncbi:MAG TPA: nitrous oxide reductase family maturation protein NosD [Candidatus Competibacteraceae bacterium]|nr:nitrous oxide reductase family maturation protein NosD [Candidatus Competibacteraceae bacterium]